MFGKLLESIFKPAPPTTGSDALDYEKVVLLDSEDLAEQGISEAYAQLTPTLRAYVASPVSVTDVRNDETDAYSVRVGEEERVVYSPELPGSEKESWGRATFLLFQIVNDQLQSAPVRFYALNGGNDLAGIFLSPDEAEAARSKLPRKDDWPYLPTIEGPWYGQPHLIPRAWFIRGIPPISPGLAERCGMESIGATAEAGETRTQRRQDCLLRCRGETPRSASTVALPSAPNDAVPAMRSGRGVKPGVPLRASAPCENSPRSNKQVNVIGHSRGAGQPGCYLSKPR